MEIKDVYIVNGYINHNGLYEDKKDYKTFIAECKLGAEEGFSYYSFLNYDNLKETFVNSGLIRLEELMPLIENPNVKIFKLNKQQLDEYKAYFLTILQNDEILKNDRKELYI